MIKILIQTPIRYDATSLYRVWGALIPLSKKYREIQLIPFEKGADWTVIMQADILFVQRPYQKDALILINYAKQMNVKVWVDYDDNLFEIPSSFEFAKLYNNTAKQIMEACIMMADIVTFSTNNLNEYISKRLLDNYNYQLKAHVINNGVNINTPIKRKQTNKILWRGSATHVDDIRHYRELITNVGNKYGLTTFGYDCVSGRPHLNIKGSKHIQPVDPIVYYDVIKTIECGIIIVPLIDNYLNQAKSNIAWLEATLSGMVCYASQVSEFIKEDCIADINHDIEDEQTKDKLYNNSIEVIAEHYNLIKLNEQRIKLIYDAMQQ